MAAAPSRGRYAPSRRRGDRLRLALRGGERQHELERERAALRDLALDGQAAAHELHDLRADREAEAGAAVGTRRAVVRLGEALEDRRLTIDRDADAGIA